MSAVRLRVAPRVAAGQPGGRVEPGRLLPLGLRRQPPPRPAGVRVGFVPAHVQHGLLRPDRLGDAEHRPDPLRPVPAPVQRGGQPGALPVIPAGLSPPAGVVVSAVRDELGVRAAGHRGGVEEERGHVHGVRGPLVVQRPGLGRGAHAERAARHGHLGRQPQRVGRRRAGRRGGQHRGALADLVGDQHRLVVLDLVLGDHPEREPVAEQPRAAPQGSRTGPARAGRGPGPGPPARRPGPRPAAAAAAKAARRADARTRRRAGRSPGAWTRARRPRAAARALPGWRCGPGPRPAGTSAANAV